MRKILSAAFAVGVMTAALTAAPQKAEAHTDFFFGLFAPAPVYVPPVVYRAPPRVVYYPQPVRYYYPAYPQAYWSNYHDRGHDWNHHYYSRDRRHGHN